MCPSGEAGGVVLNCRDWPRTGHAMTAAVVLKPTLGRCLAEFRPTRPVKKHSIPEQNPEKGREPMH